MEFRITRSLGARLNTASDTPLHHSDSSQIVGRIHFVVAAFPGPISRPSIRNLLSNELWQIVYWFQPLGLTFAEGVFSGQGSCAHVRNAAPPWVYNTKYYLAPKDRNQQVLCVGPQRCSFLDKGIRTRSIGRACTDLLALQRPKDQLYYWLKRKNKVFGTYLLATLLGESFTLIFFTRVNAA